MLDFLNHIDTRLFLFLNSFHCPVADVVMWYVSQSYTWIPFYLILAAMLVHKFKKQCWVLFLAIGLVILLSDQFASGILKPLVERLRPSHEPTLEGLVHIVNGYRGGLYGFASSHAANTFGLACFLALVFRNRVFTVGILLWATVVSYSRIYLGVHYPGDVLCGTLLGILFASLVWQLLNKLIHKHPIFNYLHRNSA